ncbi:MAG: hypothetical protein ABSF75_00810 [Terracidiphilus sp.]
MQEEAIRNLESRISSCCSFRIVGSQIGLKNSYCLPKISFQDRLTEFPVRQGYRLIADTVIGEPDCSFEIDEKATPQSHAFVKGDETPVGLPQRPQDWIGSGLETVP